MKRNKKKTIQKRRPIKKLIYFQKVIKKYITFVRDHLNKMLENVKIAEFTISSDMSKSRQD